MHVVRYRDAAEFRDVVTPFLLRDEVRHNLMLGILGTLVDSPGVYPRFHLWLVAEADRPRAAALRTPPFLVALAASESDDALTLLATEIAGEGEVVPGVVGGLPEAETFARAYCQARGAAWRTSVEQGIYALESVNDLPVPSGAPRRADPSDEDLVLSWLGAFSGDDNSDERRDVAAARRRLAPRLRGERGEGFCLWEDPDPVSLAGFVGSTPSGQRIGPVYTRPDSRRQGYATALVAHVSREVLAGGKRFCFLYTDMSNPTSNAIYQRIGYELVCHSVMLAFEDR